MDVISRLTNKSISNVMFDYNLTFDPRDIGEITHIYAFKVFELCPNYAWLDANKPIRTYHMWVY